MISNLVVVKTVQGLLQAKALQAKLESNHIPVALDYESVGPVYGITVDGLGAVRLLVPARLARRARHLLLVRRQPRPARCRRNVKARRRRDRPRDS